MKKLISPAKMHATTQSSLSHEGRAIAKVAQKTTFISYALPQEMVNFEYTSHCKTYDCAKAVEILQPHPLRIVPPCPYFTHCGGCTTQHMAAELQISYKQAVLLDHLKYIAKTVPEKILPALQGPAFGYRRKARFSVEYTKNTDSVSLGFRESNQKRIVDIDHCAVLDPRVGLRLKSIRSMLATLQSRHGIDQLEIAVGDNAIALLLHLTSALPTQDQDRLCEFAQRENFYITWQIKAAHGAENKSITLCPDTQTLPLYYRLEKEDLTVWFQPSDFIQANVALNQALVQQAIELLQPTQDETILDLFCGLGNFTLPFAKRAARVIGIEGHEASVQRARFNANYNHLSNVEFFVANLNEPCASKPWAHRSYDKIFLDPPRQGAKAILPFIIQKKPREIVYVSCDTATLARDVSLLVQQGYRVAAAGIIDMFPQTAHIEAMVKLVIRK